MYIERHLQSQIRKYSALYPVIMLCGQRQVGKSTMLYHIKEKDRTYVSLDDINARRLAETDPALFFETYRPPVLIDEFQRVPEILLEIKHIVDSRELNGDDNAGLFWLTGSQKFSMMKNASESLAGRVGIFDMSSLSSAEIAGREAWVFDPEIEEIKRRVDGVEAPSLSQVFGRIFEGGMPRIITSEIEPERYYSDYVDTYLEKDIRGYAQIGKLREFSDFLVYMAAHTAQELNYSRIASDIGISAPTAKEWVSILESSGIIYLLRPYSNNITKRLVKTPKVYFMDTGLAAYLTRWPDPETLSVGAMSGAFFETYVVSEIVKSYFNAGQDPDLYYYRDKDQKEIDLVICRSGKIWPIEIKKSMAPAHPDKNFQALDKTGMIVEPGIVLCLNDKLIPINRKAWLCPVGVL